jgi:hypothetical protein
MESQILSKLYDMGVLNLQSKLSDIENKLTVAAFCRRRLAVVMTHAKMAETVSAVSCCYAPFIYEFWYVLIMLFALAPAGCKIHRTRSRPRRT